MVCNICFKRLNIVQSREKKSVGVRDCQVTGLNLSHDFSVVAVAHFKGNIDIFAIYNRSYTNIITAVIFYVLR